MKKFLEIFFIILGVIFFIIILAGVYLFVADPFEIKPLIRSFTEMTAAPESTNQNPDSKAVDASPLLSAEQENALRSVGIDPAKLPTEITPTMEACFYLKLGKERADQIKAGAAPNAADLFKAKTCIQ